MSRIVIDIETVPHECAAAFVPEPDLDAIRPAGNLKDPVKIAEDVEKKRAAAVEDRRIALSRAALDWNLSRIVAIGWWHEADADAQAVICRDEQDEAAALTALWKRAQNAEIVGFCARTFDVPTLLQRSRLLRVRPGFVSLNRYGKGTVIDLRDILTFDDARYEAIMPRSLKTFCRRFGVPVEDAIDGAQVPQLVADSRWNDVVAHVVSDVRITHALAVRLGVLQDVTVAMPF
jgi:hypothetical protein